MRRFRVKDLMLQVLPEGGEPEGCPYNTIRCSPCTDWAIISRNGPYLTPGRACFNCSILISEWIPCPHPSYVPPNPWEDRPSSENLTVLKQQLKQALAEVERQEKLMVEMESPQTLEEAEALELKLTEALAEVKARKEQLQK